MGDPLKDLLKALTTPAVEGPLKRLDDCARLVSEGGQRLEGSPSPELIAETSEGLLTLGKGIRNHVVAVIWEVMDFLEDLAGPAIFDDAIKSWSLARMTKNMTDEEARDFMIKMTHDVDEVAARRFGTTDNGSQ